MLSSRSLLIILNTFFFLLGIGILSIGLWSQYDKNFSILWSSIEISKIVDARILNSASLLLVISGFTSVFVSFLGLYGSVKKDRCFLTTYCLLMCIILILEIVAASVFVSYRNDLVSKSKLNDTVSAINKENDKVALQIMNIIQPVFKCCGCEGPSDYLNLTQMISCQTNDSTPEKPVYYQKGCYEAITQYFDNHLPVILGLSITLILFQLFCLIISIKTCAGIRYEGYEDI